VFHDGSTVNVLNYFHMVKNNYGGKLLHEHGVWTQSLRNLVCNMDKTFTPSPWNKLNLYLKPEWMNDYGWKHTYIDGQCKFFKWIYVWWTKSQYMCSRKNSL
jgi:hypothetical protein